MTQSFSWQRLDEVLQRFPSSPRYWVAFSGGIDSHALLHAMSVLRERQALPRIAAAHINHSLHPEANGWESHCVHVCQSLRIPFQAIRVQAHPQAGESPEAAARQARYQALLGLIGDEEILLTAHHRDDQAETLLLQLMRGAGPLGLAAMPAWARFGQGWLGRPLLEVSRAMLERYGHAQGLHWISDSSNADTRHDRNFIRHRVLPILKQRWPSIDRTLSRVAENQQDAACLLQDVAMADWRAIRGRVPDTLSRPGLAALAPERQRNVVRYWLSSLGFPMPARMHVETILSDAGRGREETSPCVRWPGAEIRRYRDTLYAMRLQSAGPAFSQPPLAWDFKTPLEVGEGQLRAAKVMGAGLLAGLSERQSVEVRLRRGGERCRPAGCQYTRTLKKLFQERGVPPWERGRLPLIYVDGNLAAVADLWVCEPFATREGETGWRLSWHTYQVSRDPNQGSRPFRGASPVSCLGASDKSRQR